MPLLLALTFVGCTPEGGADTSTTAESDTDTSTDSSPLDGVYAGDLSFHMKLSTSGGDAEDDCTGAGTLSVEIDMASGEPMVGSATCAYAGELASMGTITLVLTGTVSDANVPSGELSVQDMTVPWTGAFDGDTLTGSYDVSEDTGYAFLWIKGTFTATR